MWLGLHGQNLPGLHNFTSTERCEDKIDVEPYAIFEKARPARGGHVTNRNVIHKKIAMR